MKVTNRNEIAIKRDRKDASRCIHVLCKPNMQISVQEIKPSRGSIEIPGVSKDMTTVVRQLIGAPDLKLVCKSPDYIDFIRKGMTEMPDVANQIVELNTNFDICMCCRYFSDIREEVIQ